jgi:hypothetical protein
MIRRDSEAARRFAERRRREDEAPRLAEVAPKLLSLKLDFVERKGNLTLADVAHTRHVIVERAPALFEIACADRGCVDGGHDLTRDVLRAVGRNEGTFEGDDACHGHVGSATCGRTLHFAAVATYRAD